MVLQQTHSSKYAIYIYIRLADSLIITVWSSELQKNHLCAGFEDIKGKTYPKSVAR